MTTNHPADETGEMGREREELVLLFREKAHLKHYQTFDSRIILSFANMEEVADAIIAAGFRKAAPMPAVGSERAGEDINWLAHAAIDAVFKHGEVEEGVIVGCAVRPVADAIRAALAAGRGGDPK